MRIDHEESVKYYRSDASIPCKCAYCKNYVLQNREGVPLRMRVFEDDEHRCAAAVRTIPSSRNEIWTIGILCMSIYCLRKLRKPLHT